MANLVRHSLSCCSPHRGLQPRQEPRVVRLRGLGVILQHESHWFDSPAGCLPGLRVQSLVGRVQEAADGCFFPSLTLSLKTNINKSGPPCGTPCPLRGHNFSCLSLFFFFFLVCFYPATVQMHVIHCELFPSACLPLPVLSVLIYSQRVYYAGAEPN